MKHAKFALSVATSFYKMSCASLLPKWRKIFLTQFSTTGRGALSRIKEYMPGWKNIGTSNRIRNCFITYNLTKNKMMQIGRTMCANAGQLRNPGGIQSSRVSSLSTVFFNFHHRFTVYIVFGASGGIGSELCRRLAQNGSSVVLVGRDKEKLEEVHPELDLSSSLMIEADPLNSQDVSKVFKTVSDKFGRIHGVANCVGSILLKPAHTTSDAEFHNVMSTNLLSSFNILRESVKSMMKTEGGSIAFCSSTVGLHGVPNHEAIAAAKGAVQGLALSAAATYGPRNIRVNCVAPGLTRTPMSAKLTSSEAAVKSSLAMHTIKRLGEPVDIASALEFLLHPENSWITGQVLAVDGGLSSVRAS